MIFYWTMISIAWIFNIVGWAHLLGVDTPYEKLKSHTVFRLFCFGMGMLLSIFCVVLLPYVRGE